MRTCARLVVSLCSVLLAVEVQAGSDGRLHVLDREAIDTPAFLKHHPDIRWRYEAMDALDNGDRVIAFRHFVRAASYGDKPSQAMVAEMYWLGSGTPADRALAYAWMDLAAERRYAPLLARREHYWHHLSAAEQVRALDVGQQVYAEYGDDVALPRLAKLLDRGKRQMTGSRLGAQVGTRAFYPGSGASTLELSGNCGFAGPDLRVCLGFSVSGDAKQIVRMWDTKFWDTCRYLTWKETELDFELTGYGQVEVMPIEAVEHR